MTYPEVLLETVISFLESANKKAAAYHYARHQCISELSTFRIGGPADIVVRPTSHTALNELLVFLTEQGVRYQVVGKLSNLLFADAGFRGALILTSNICSMMLEDGVIFADAGAALTTLCQFAYQHSLGGFEDLYGIPASVGGAVYMNAGAFDTTVSTLLLGATVYDTQDAKARYLSKDALAFGPRTSLLQAQRNLILLSAHWKASYAPSDEISAKMRQRLLYRRNTQPLNFPSAGSVFRRPIGHYAGALIEECGLKGMRIGDAMVSEKHAGFIVNCGRATAKDVLSLIELIQKRVEDRASVQLRCEIEYIPEA